MDATDRATVGRSMVSRWVIRAFTLPKNSPGRWSIRSPRKPLSGPGRSPPPPAVGEADHHRLGDEADQIAEPEHTHGDQHGARQHGGHEQVLHAVPDDDAVDDGDEGPGGADLNPGSAKGEIRKPATMAVQMPAVGDMPEAMAKAMARAERRPSGRRRRHDRTARRQPGRCREAWGKTISWSLRNRGGIWVCAAKGRDAEEWSPARYDAGRSIACRRSGHGGAAVQVKRLSLAAALPDEALCITSTSIFTAGTRRPWRSRHPRTTRPAGCWPGNPATGKPGLP